jgi:hypothetical protein
MLRNLTPPEFSSNSIYPKVLEKICSNFGVFLGVFGGSQKGGKNRVFFRVFQGFSRKSMLLRDSWDFGLKTF